MPINEQKRRNADCGIECRYKEKRPRLLGAVNLKLALVERPDYFFFLGAAFFLAGAFFLVAFFIE